MLEFEVKRERVPCLYELSYKKGDPPALQLRIHNDFLEAKKGIVHVQGVLESIKKEHNLGEFSPLGGEYFGFDKALKKGKTEGEFTEFDISVPVLRKQMPEMCKQCDGKGWDEFFKRECSWCEGGKHEIFYDWRSLTAISASLQVFDMMAEIFNKKTSAKNCQLLTFQVFCGKESFPMSGSYGIDFCNWLASLSDRYRFNQVIMAMADVYAHIFQRKQEFWWDFDVYVDENAWLIINCPGDACGLHPCDSYWKAGRGREFSCHNLDNPMQQLTLLSALAVLSDLARSENIGCSLK